MNTFDHVALTFSSAAFVFCFLSALVPSPSDPVRGDNRMIGAFLAAIAAGEIAWLIA